MLPFTHIDVEGGLIQVIIEVDGQKYKITNFDEFSQKLLDAIGFQLENEIRRQIDDMKLVETGKFRTGITHTVEGNELILTSTAPYAAYLEYGTMEYFRKFGMDRFPNKPVPKKKNMSREKARKLPKGIAPFAPFRRTLWSQQLMNQIITKAIKIAKK